MDGELGGARRTATDAAIAAACRRGEQWAWGVMVERFAPYLYAVARRGYDLDHPLAEDVVQEVFARAHEQLTQLRDDAALRPWLGQIARRLAIDVRRSSSREEPAVDEQQPEAADDQEAEVLSRLEQGLALRAALDRLPERHREVVTRFFFDDEDYQSISQTLELPMGTVASRLSRALTRLRQDLGSPDGAAL